MARIAINGFGRIGKLCLRSILMRKIDLEVVAVNDLGGPEMAAHLFKYDSTYGVYPGTVECDESNIIVDGKKIQVVSNKDPLQLPWKDLKIDIVLECTGAFKTKEAAAQHITAGAKRVIISAPAKDQIDGTFVMGVNEDTFDPEKHFVLSNASCTTNCLAPVVKVLLENFGIQHGLMNTIHSVTSSQPVIDTGLKDFRRSRAAFESIVPTTTGAAKAISLVIPEMTGKLDGFAMRIPTMTVSVVDLTFVSEKELSVESINAAFKKASEGGLKGILGFEEKELVSRDFRQDDRSSIVDALSTMVMGKNFAKVVSWYDNEWGYASRLVDLAKHVSS